MPVRARSRRPRSSRSRRPCWYLPHRACRPLPWARRRPCRRTRGWTGGPCARRACQRAAPLAAWACRHNPCRTCRPSAPRSPCSRRCEPGRWCPCRCPSSPAAWTPRGASSGRCRRRRSAPRTRGRCADTRPCALPSCASVQSFNGVGALAGGETSNARVVKQVVEKAPVAATAATRSSVPSALSAAA